MTTAAGSSLMRREIEEIPAVVERFLADGASETARVAEALSRARPRFAVVMGRGTSDHAGVYARYLIEGTLGVPAGLGAASLTTLYGARVDWGGCLLLAISQSGGGPDVTEVTAAARAQGALTVAVTNEPGSPLAEAAEHVIDCRAGREASVAATKTYVAELAAVAALVARLVPGEIASDLPRTPARLQQTLEHGIGWLEGPEAPAVEFVSAERALVVSRGYNLATALEVALKLKETSRIFAEGYSSADLLHGPIVLAGMDVPTLVFRPDGRVGSAIDAGIRVVQRAGGQPWLVGGREVAGLERALALRDPGPEPLTPLTFAIVGQLLAEAVARGRGLDPDRPPGLTKVTRTR